MTVRQTAYIAGILVIVISSVSFFWNAPVLFVEQVVGQDKLLGGVLFGAIMFFATVIAPVTVLPIVPLIAPVLGPLMTAVISIISWTLGAVVAFLIARYAGRPFLSRFISLETIDRYEMYIPDEARFFMIVALRVLIPVDILSYALGFFSSISLLKYTLATVLGISWFAFIFAYLGEAAFTGDGVLFGVLAFISLSLLVLGWGYMLQRVRKRSK